MADFCMQCTSTNFGPELAAENDMAGMTTEEDSDNGICARVLCEGCGFTIVDHTGKCLNHLNHKVAP